MMYGVEVVIGCTGGGFRYETNNLKEVEETISEYSRNKINQIRVYDEKIQDFIYWKKALSCTPIIDLLHATKRDFRYKERHY